MTLPIRLDILPQPTKLRKHCLEIDIMYRLCRLRPRCQATTRIADAGCRTAYEGDYAVAMMVQPEQDHQGEEMTEMERRGGGVNAGVEAQFARFKETVESIAIPLTYLSAEAALLYIYMVPRSRVFRLPSYLIYVSTLLEHSQYALLLLLLLLLLHDIVVEAF